MTSNPPLMGEISKTDEAVPHSAVYPYGATTQAYYSHPTTVPETRQPRARGRIRLLLRVLAYEAAALLFVFFVARHIAHRSGWGHRWLPWMSSPYDSHAPPESVIERCARPSDWAPASPSLPTPYAASTSFSLPASSDLLFLLARGPLAHGNVHIVTEQRAGETIDVDVQAFYYRQEPLDRTDVCLMKRGEGGHGIGILTPRGWPRGSQFDRLRFDVTVRLPINRGQALNITAFETDLPLFAHDIGRLADDVEFGSLDLKTSNSPIIAQSVSAGRISLDTSNSPIEGSFNTSHRLSLVTSNARILAEVGLLQADGADAPTEAFMKTSNAHVDAAISLLTPSNEGGAYVTNLHTSNAPLTVYFPTSPLASTLRGTISTSNAQARAVLDAAYEGAFTVHTSVFAPRVERREGVEDPSGAGRSRREMGGGGKGWIDGRVWWDGEGNERRGTGEVNIKTSNALAVLVL